MQLVFHHWISLSLAITALAGVLVVVIALVRQRQDLHATAQAIADSAARSAAQAAEHAAREAADEVGQQVARQESERIVKPLTHAHKDLLQQFATLEQRQQELETGFEALREKQQTLSSQQGQLQELQQRLQASQKALESRQAEIEEQTPESRFYQRAAKLVEKGASVEELMMECEIPRNEAELLISLHRRGE